MLRARYDIHDNVAKPGDMELHEPVLRVPEEHILEIWKKEAVPLRRFTAWTAKRSEIVRPGYRNDHDGSRFLPTPFCSLTARSAAGRLRSTGAPATGTRISMTTTHVCFRHAFTSRCSATPGKSVSPDPDDHSLRSGFNLVVPQCHGRGA